MWVLASASPRRRSLVAEAGGHCIVDPSGYIEDNTQPLAPEELVRRQALGKARDVARRRADGLAVVGADTVVACAGEVLGKPCDRNEARRMIRRLAGTAHLVHTGVALVMPEWERTWCVTTEIVWRPLTAAEIERYLDTDEWTDKAGAYGIQGAAGAFVTARRGSLTNVIGLPVRFLCTRLAEHGVEW